MNIYLTILRLLSSAYLGMLSAWAGYPISTWQWWVFTVPAILVLQSWIKVSIL
jgi:hypothetical protein